MLHKVTIALTLLFFAAMPIAGRAATISPKVVFIGDQFTYNWATTPGAFPSNWINKGWNKAAYTSDPNCFVTCEGGTSESTEARFQTDVINLHPNIVHIMVGADDADANDDASVPYIYPNFLNSVESMIKMAKAANIQVILGIESNQWSSEGGAYFEQMNSMVATLGAQKQHSGHQLWKRAVQLCRVNRRSRNRGKLRHQPSLHGADCQCPRVSANACWVRTDDQDGGGRDRNHGPETHGRVPANRSATE